MFELLPKGAVQENQLPGFILSWVDKTCLDQCMYSAGAVRSWGPQHLKSGGWYIDCGGGFCPADEDATKKAIDQREKGLGGSSSQPPSGNQSNCEADDVVDLSHLTDKEKAKAERKIQRATERAEAKRVLDEQKRADKALKADLVANVKARAAEAVASIKATGKAPKSLHVVGASTFDDTQTSSASPSQGHRKRDASAIDLSVSRLSLAHLQVAVEDTVDLPEQDAFIFNGSLHSLLAHRIQYGVFPSGWSELQAFLEKVRS